MSSWPSEIIIVYSENGVNRHRHSLSSFAGFDYNRTPITSTRPRSQVWDEVGSIKQRLENLKLEPKSTTSQSNGADVDDNSKAINGHAVNGNNGKDILSTASSSASKEDNNDKTNISASDDDDWEKTEPISTIISSPILPSYLRRSHTSHGSSHYPNGHATNTNNYNYNNNGLLTRQSPAERHLLEVVDRAKRMRDHDMLVVLLERVAIDTIALYNQCSNHNPRQLDAIDRTCLSLSDFILQFLDSTEQDIHHGTNNNNSNTSNNTLSSSIHQRYSNLLSKSSPLTRSTPTSIRSSSSTLLSRNRPSTSHGLYDSSRVTRNSSLREDLSLTGSNSSPIRSNLSPVNNNRRYGRSSRLYYYDDKNKFF